MLAFEVRIGVEGLREGVPVVFGRPEFEALGLAAEGGRAVGGQLLQVLGEQFVASFGEHGADRADDQLQGGGSLLPVDNLVPGNVADPRGPGLVDDRAEEVVRDGGLLAVCGDLALRHAEDVGPQWRPLVLLVPHVRPLERRDLVVHLPVEELAGAEGICFQLASLRFRTVWTRRERNGPWCRHTRHVHHKI
ncbi:hypothetical protein GCM10029992_24890 [Glycomyces albus]